MGFVGKLQINSKIVMSKINKLLKKLGPGLLFAGAAIGVSHLVQSTRAGAEFGMGLLWALILVNIFKYPFFQYGPRYATATGESLLDGYYKLGRGILIAYAIITLATMFTIQTAVTIVTAGLAIELFGITNKNLLVKVKDSSGKTYRFRGTGKQIIKDAQFQKIKTRNLNRIYKAISPSKKRKKK